MAEECQFGYAKFTLGTIDGDAKLFAAIKYKSKVALMFLRRSASNQNVINVHVNEWEAMQHLINKTLESLSSVPQTKWHSQKLK